MSEIIRARVEERLTRLRLGSVASRLDAILSQAARKEPTYLDFLDEVLGDELEAKQKKRVAMADQSHARILGRVGGFSRREPPCRPSAEGCGR